MQLFDAALEQPEPERRAWLDGQPGIDDDVRLEVASLLEAHANARDFLAPGRTHRSEG